MKKWYSSILKDLRMLGDKIYVYDPTGMFRDKNLYKELMKKYILHEFKDEGSLYLFFSKNKGNPLLVYSTRNIQRDFIDRNFKKKELLLSDVFQGLDSSMLKELDLSYYQTLYNDYSERKNQGLDLGSTEDLILKSIWDIDLGKLHSLTENFKIALAYIIDHRDIPKSIIDNVSKKLSIDIRELKNNEPEFLSWIKLQIKTYISQKESDEYPTVQLSESLIQFYLLKLSLVHDLELPIDDDMIYKEGWLSKFKKEPSKKIIETKIKSMIEDYHTKMDELTKKEFDFNELDNIMTVSRLFCEIIYQIQTNDDLKMSDFLNLDSEYESFDRLFRDKLINERNNNYESLFYASASDKPLTVDKILNYAKTKFEKRIALLVMDGMSYDEWFLLREHLDEFKKTESSVFAILPTVTAFSRTSIFSGKTPKEFMNAKFEFNEEKEFYKSMSEMGFRENNVLFGHVNLKKNMIKSNGEDKQYEHLKGYDFLGLICNLFDDLSHEDVLIDTGKRNYYKNARNNLNASSIKKLIHQLKEDGYTIILTADHGNIFCQGNGIKINKNLQIGRESVRCLFYDRDSFAEQVTNQNPQETFSYKYSEIPENLILIFPVKNDCFKNKGDYAITHGGISPEELIVPLVVLE